MKNWQFNGLFLALIMAALVTVLQSNRPETLNTEQFAGVGGYVRANYRLDTITNTEMDTFGLVSRNSTTANNALSSYTPLLSLYTLDLAANRISISGTPNVKIYLDKSSTATPTAGGWMLLDSTTTTSGVGQIKISELTGEIYRIRVKGTGTQSTSYRINCLLKKKN